MIGFGWLSISRTATGLVIRMHVTEILKYLSMENSIQVAKGLVSLMSATYYSSTSGDHLAGNDQEYLAWGPLLQFLVKSPMCGLELGYSPRVDHACCMLIKFYIEALPVDDNLAAAGWRAPRG